MCGSPFSEATRGPEPADDPGAGEGDGGGPEAEGESSLLSARSGVGWQRGPRQERSAGGVVVRRIGGVLHLLLIKDPYGHWGLPKGHVEPDEGPAEAALREVREETGLGDLELGPELRTIDWYFRVHGKLVHKHCTFYLMTSQDGETRPQREEGISACRWLPMAEALEKVEYANAREVVKDAMRLLLGEPESGRDVQE